MKGNSLRALHPLHVLKGKALPLAIGSILFGFTGSVWAQATSGTIYGTVPAVAGEAVQITGG